MLTIALFQPPPNLQIFHPFVKCSEWLRDRCFFAGCRMALFDTMRETGSMTDGHFVF